MYKIFKYFGLKYRKTSEGNKYLVERGHVAG
jgi:hypothetical protein